jgi:hypothetical protein
MAALSAGGIAIEGVGAQADQRTAAILTNTSRRDGWRGTADGTVSLIVEFDSIR